MDFPVKYNTKFLKNTPFVTTTVTYEKNLLLYIGNWQTVVYSDIHHGGPGKLPLINWLPIHPRR